MVNTEIIHAVYAKLENRPGSLEHVCKVVGERRVNIDSLTLETIGNTGYARFLVKNAPTLVEALRQNHVESYETELVLASIPNKPNELYRATSELAAARLNIESVFATPEGRLAIRTNDNEMAARILGKL